jgi:hypothetical protein
MDGLLSSAITAARSIQISDHAQCASQEEQPGSSTPDTLASLNEVQELISANNIKARKQFMQLCSSLSKYRLDDEVATAVELLDKLNFPAALIAVEDIKERMRHQV